MPDIQCDSEVRNMPAFMPRLRRIRKASPLSFRLLAWILLFSTAFTLLAAGVQIYSDYRKDLSLIEERMEVIESGYASSLARSLWALDQKLLQTQMEGILSLPDITHLRLRIEPDSELVMGEIPRNTDTLTHSFQLVYEEGELFELGELTITANLHRIYSDLRTKVGVTLATQFLTIFIVSTLVLWIFRHLVTRHLAAMAQYTRDLSLKNLSRPLHLDRHETPANKRDELGMVTDAINQMRERLNDDVDRRERDAADILKFSKAIDQSPQ